MRARLGPPQAVVASARKLLVVVWQGLSSRAADRRAAADQVACTLLGWAQQLRDAQRSGLTSRHCNRYHLLRLGIGHDRTRMQRGGTPRPIASIEEVLALRPALRPPT